MDWLQFGGFIATVVGLFLWNRSENRNANRAINASIESQGNRMEKISASIRDEMTEFHNQVKDFHGRLCTLEERHLQLMQRFLEERNTSGSPRKVHHG